MTRASGSPQPVPAGDHVLKGGWYTLWVVLAVTLFGVIDRQVLTLAAAPMAASLSLSDSQLGMVQGLAFAIFTAVAVYPIAWAADRFDRRIVLGACVTVWSVGTAACGLARNFEELFLAAVAIAAGEAGLLPLATSYIPELFKGRKRLLANGLTYILSFLGLSAALALGGSAIGFLDGMHADLPPSLQSFESWQLAFFLVALPAPLFLLLLAWTRLGRPRDGRKGTKDEQADSRFWPFVRQNRRAVALLLSGLGLYALPVGAYHAWVAVAATRLFGTTPAENGAAMGIATAICMIGGVAAGTFFVRRLIVKMGPMATVRFFWITILVSTPLLLVFPLAGTAWQLFTLFACVMLVATAIGCMVPTILQDMAPTDLRARMFAIWGIIYGMLHGVASALVGWTSSTLGGEPRTLLVALGLVAAPSWIMAVLLLRLAERPFAGLIHLVQQRERGAA